MQIPSTGPQIGHDEVVSYFVAVHRPDTTRKLSMISKVFGDGMIDVIANTTKDVDHANDVMSHHDGGF